MNVDPRRITISRRNLLAVGGAGAALLALPACGSSEAVKSSTSTSLEPAPTTGPVSVQRPVRVYDADDQMVFFRRSLPLDTPRARYADFPSGQSVLKRGTVHREGALPLPCDILAERNVAVTMRDGTTIYTDIFRPTGPGRFPALFGYSPYGKAFGGQWLDDVADRSGVPLSTVSELERFEGADPAYWVNHGYAVLNLDPRGVGKSEGDIHYWGKQLSEDGYDFIEWIAEQSWSDSKVAMTGNSFLAVSQWFIAAEKPPHLTAIAPWEGFSDHFREVGNRGCIPAPAFAETILATFSGQGLVEDGPLMMSKEQTLTPYWKDKEVRLDRIDIPAYVVASWTNQGHTNGTFRAWRGLASADKWLRVHNNQEWQDFYDPSSTEELRAFFDHYVKGQDNGWEKTPRIRLSILDPGGTDTVGRVERAFPLARTSFTPYYLTAAGALAPTKESSTAEVTYPVTGDGVSFTVRFDKQTEITGYMSLRLWVEARGSDDMELAFSIDKLDAQGKAYTAGSMILLTATGYQRVSMRKLDTAKSTPSEPVLLCTTEERLKAGEIVPIDVNIWPMGMRYQAGQQLRLTVAPNKPKPGALELGYGVAPITVPADGGTHPVGAKVDTITLGGSKDLPDFVEQQRSPTPENRNKGTHVLHVGGTYDSHLLLPVIPT